MNKLIFLFLLPIFLFGQTVSKTEILNNLERGGTTNAISASPLSTHYVLTWDGDEVKIVTVSNLGGSFETITTTGDVTVGGNLSIAGTSGASYGVMACRDSAVTLSITQNTYAMVTNATGDLLDSVYASGMTFDSDSIIIGTTGLYEFILSISFAGTAADVWEGRIYVNGAAHDNYGFTRTTGNADIGSASMNGILSLTALDGVSIYITNTASNDDCTIRDVSLKLNQL